MALKTKADSTFELSLAMTVLKKKKLFSRKTTSFSVSPALYLEVRDLNYFQAAALFQGLSLKSPRSSLPIYKDGAACFSARSLPP